MSQSFDPYGDSENQVDDMRAWVRELEARLAQAEADNKRLVQFAKSVAYFGTSLIRAEYEAGSPTVTDLVDEARALAGEEQT